MKYKRMNLESSKVYKLQLKEFYEKYPDAQELLKRYILHSTYNVVHDKECIIIVCIMLTCRKRKRKDSGR